VITWTPDQEIHSLYIVYKLNIQTRQYIPIDSTTGSSLLDWPAAAGTYWYKVQTKQDGIYSDLSVPVSTYFSAQLETPRMYYCEDIDSTVLVTWYGVTGAQKFHVFRGVGSDNLTWIIDISGSNGFFDRPPQEGWYYYAVTAETQGGLESERSAPDSVYFTP
jgi:hypothetical protein